MKTKELRDKTSKDLSRQADKLRAKLAEIARGAAAEQKNVRQIRALKRDLARTLTIISEKED